MPANHVQFVGGTDLSETQQQLLDINQRYEILGERLADRQQELQNVLASIKTFLQDMQDVLSWLDVKDGELSTKAAGGISANEKTAKKKLKEHEVCTVVVCMFVYCFL